MEKELLISNEDIIRRVKELGKEITNDYKGEKVTLIGILKGCIYFFVDLSREIDLELEIDFIRVSSYEGTESTGKINMKLDIDESIQDKNIIIIDDISDTGYTLDYLIKHFKKQNPKSIKVCTLLDKKERRIVRDLVVDYVGFTIPDYFVFGYGLDVDQKYRDLSDIYYFPKE